MASSCMCSKTAPSSWVSDVWLSLGGQTSEDRVSRALGSLVGISIDQQPVLSLNQLTMSLTDPFDLTGLSGFDSFSSSLFLRKEPGFGSPQRRLRPILISASDSINQSTTDDHPPRPPVQPSLEAGVKLIGRIHTPQVNPEVLLRSVSKIAAASYTDQS